MKRSTREYGILAGLCALAAALLVLLCSQSSPLYPINTWGDANCLLTVGRVMREGGVIYRDVYEQKGPTLYLIHALAACISDGSFLGVYVMEVLSLTAALMLAVLMIGRGRPCPSAFALCTLAVSCVMISSAFAKGDSAEEFCLPFLTASAAIAADAYGQRPQPMAVRRLFVCGLMAGLVATIKFTVLGLFLGLCAAEGALALRAGGLRRALRSAGVFLAGMLLPVALWCAYFALHGALSDFYTAYIHNNVFLYSGEPRTAADVLRALVDTARGGVLFVLLAGGGTLLFLLDRRQAAALRGAVAAMALGAFAGVYLLGRTWPYSPMALCVFAFVGMARPAAWLQKQALRVQRILCAACCACALILALLLSPNAPVRGQTIGELAQGRLAEYVEPGATLLQYRHLDDGLYLTSGTLPQEKYFVLLNVAHDEMKQALAQSLHDGRPDYVLTSWEPLEAEFDRYQLIAQDAGYDDLNRINKPMYLYRRK